MNFLTSTGARLLFALPLVAFGLSHYANAEAMSGMVPSYMPLGGMFWTYASGTSLILAAISIVIKKLDYISCLSLAGTVFAFALMVHLPNMMGTDPMMKMMGTVSFLKDTMIAGGALAFAHVAEKKPY